MSFLICSQFFFLKQNFRYLLTFASNLSIPQILTHFIPQAGVTLLLINLSNQTHFILNVKNPVTVKANEVAKNVHEEKNSFFHNLKKAFSWIGTKGSEVTFREEYHLTPKDNNLKSQTMVLNGIPLKLTNEGDIPTMDPVHNNVRSPIYIDPLSIAFIVYPNFDAPACARY